MRIDEIEKKVVGLLVLLSIFFYHYHRVRGYASYTATTDILTIFVNKLRVWSKCVEDLRIPSNVAGSRWGTVLQKLQGILSNIGQYKYSNLHRDSKMSVEEFYKEVVRKNTRLMSIVFSRTIIESIMRLINLCDGRVAYMARARKADGR